jgi:hypothetical protein
MKVQFFVRETPAQFENHKLVQRWNFHFVIQKDAF